MKKIILAICTICTMFALSANAKTELIMVSTVRKNKWRILSATFLLKHLSKNKHFKNKKRVCHKSVTHPFFCVFLYILVES